MDQKAAPWWGRYLLAGSALALLAGAIGVAWAMNEKQLAGNLSMGLLAIASGTVLYFFQSSAGSDRKDDALAKANEALATSAPVVAPNSTPQP